MKESKKSLKWYFIVIGVLWLWNLSKIGIINGDVVLGIFLLISAIFGGIFLYIGVKLNELLNRSQKFIINFLLIELAFLVISGLYNIIKGSFVAVNIVSLIISVVITLYLIKNVKELSAPTQIQEQK